MTLHLAAAATTGSERSAISCVDSYCQQQGNALELQSGSNVAAVGLTLEQQATGCNMANINF